MPKGPQGQKRPADVIGNAVHVMRIATREIEEGGQPKKAAGLSETLWEMSDIVKLVEALENQPSVKH